MSSNHDPHAGAKLDAASGKGHAPIGALDHGMGAQQDQLARLDALAELAKAFPHLRIMRASRSNAGALLGTITSFGSPMA